MIAFISRRSLVQVQPPLPGDPVVRDSRSVPESPDNEGLYKKMKRLGIENDFDGTTETLSG